MSQDRSKASGVHPFIEQLRHLPIEEKMQIVGDLWDDIAAQSGTLQLSPEYCAELDRRIAEMEADPEGGLTEQEFWSRIRIPHAS